MSDPTRLRDLFDQAADLPPADRPAFLDAACGDDAGLRAEVESLLRALDTAADLAAAPPPPADAMPESVGPYRLLSKLGQGGMGTVYKAEQRTPVRRTVAVKVIRPGLDSAEVVARFEAERQALAMMSHPGIARVLDAGSDDRGRPYFVMEYVPGVPITAYADRERLSVADRLDLFAQACDAVAHAHAKAILHRDVKAGNVLAYTADGGRAAVKVIDFGIAKALSGDRLTDRTYDTRPGVPIGTYESMAPEQADGSPDVDARADVYGLGVLLYELLSGAKPLDRQMLAGAADAEVRRVIRDVDPPRPSTRLSSLDPAAGSTVAGNRRLLPAALVGQLRSDLELIPMMCLRKERDRRYASPLLLAADCRAYLAGLPLLAGPDTRRYRLGKLARRNKGLLAAAAAVALALVLGMVGTTAGLVRASHQRAEADRQRRSADAQRQRAEARFADVRSLARDLMFKVDDALINVAGATRGRRILADTARHYLDAVRTDAAADAALDGGAFQSELADSYEKVGQILANPYLPNVGDSAGAIAMYGQAVTIRRALAAAAPHDAGAALNLATTYSQLADLESVTTAKRDALAHYTRSAQMLQAVAHANPDRVLARTDLGVAEEKVGDMQAATGDAAAALATYADALALRKQLVLDDPHSRPARRAVAVTDEKIGDLLLQTGRPADADRSYDRFVEAAQALAAEDPTDVQAERDLWIAQTSKGNVALVTNRLGEARGWFTRAQTVCRALHRADADNARAAIDLANCQAMVGQLQASDGQTAAAMASLADALSLFTRAAAQSPTDVRMRQSVAGTHFQIAQVIGRTADDEAVPPADRLAAARRAAEEALAAARGFHSLRDDHQLTGTDATLPDDADALARQYAGRAVELQRAATTRPATTGAVAPPAGGPVGR